MCVTFKTFALPAFLPLLKLGVLSLFSNSFSTTVLLLCHQLVVVLLHFLQRVDLSKQTIHFSTTAIQPSPSIVSPSPSIVHPSPSINQLSPSTVERRGEWPAIAMEDVHARESSSNRTKASERERISKSA